MVRGASYTVTGRLIDAGTMRPMAGFSVIGETGIRDEESPLCLVGIRKQARTDTDGGFEAMFFARGTATPAEIEVHIEFSPGIWRCRVVPIESADVQIGEDDAVHIGLGSVEVDYDKCRVPKVEPD